MYVWYIHIQYSICIYFLIHAVSYVFPYHCTNIIAKVWNEVLISCLFYNKCRQLDTAKQTEFQWDKEQNLCRFSVLPCLWAFSHLLFSLFAKNVFFPHSLSDASAPKNICCQLSLAQLSIPQVPPLFLFHFPFLSLWGITSSHVTELHTPLLALPKVQLGWLLRS